MVVLQSVRTIISNEQTIPVKANSSFAPQIYKSTFKMMNPAVPPPTNIIFPTSSEALVAPYQPQQQQPSQAQPGHQLQNPNHYERTGSRSPDDQGRRLLAMLNDVLPLVDQDPEMLALMQDVTRLVCEYQ
jgi:hypothetical protein